MSRARTNALALAGYTAIAFGYFGWRLAPHPGRYVLGSGRDPQIFVWAFAWWPHALATWQNPFVTHAVYAPDGMNLAWATTVPLLSLAFSPLTVLAGPTAAYNVAALLMPALAAWTAFLLCRDLTRSPWAGLAGGYLYGFSSYMLGQELGHLNLTATFLVPLVALVLVRFVRGELDGRGLTWRLGALLGLQFWLSTEVLFTLTLALLVTLALAYGLLRSARPRLLAGAGPIAAGYALAALIAGPLAYYAVTGFQSESINDPRLFDADLLNFVVPTRLIAIGGSTFAGISSRFAGNDAERGAYLGLPTLVLVAWFAVRGRRSAATWLPVGALAAAAVATVGTALEVEGRKVLWLPWSEIARAPLFDNALPSRFALYGSLAAAVIVALWTAGSRGLPARLLPSLAVAALVPAVWHADYRLLPERWPFFTTGLYRSCIPRGENVAIFPYGFWGNSMLWQAETDFWFRLAEGYLRPKPPPSYLADPTVAMLTYTTDNPTPAQILAFAKDKQVDRIISVDIYVHPNGTQMHRFGPVQDVGGVLVSPACGYASLRKGVHPTPPHPTTG